MTRSDWRAGQSGLLKESRRIRATVEMPFADGVNRDTNSFDR